MRIPIHLARPKNQKMQADFCSTEAFKLLDLRTVRLNPFIRQKPAGRRIRAGKALLSKRFVEDDGGAVGQVERSGGGMEHWDAEPAVWVLIKQLWRQSGGFPAKEKEVFGGVLNFGVVFGHCGFDKPKPSPSAVGCAKGLPVVPSMPQTCCQ